jgi:hypothetical protein
MTATSTVMSFAGDGKERFASDTFHTDCVDIHASFKNGAKEGLYLLYIKKFVPALFSLHYSFSPQLFFRRLTQP